MKTANCKFAMLRTSKLVTTYESEKSSKNYLITLVVARFVHPPKRIYPLIKLSIHFVIIA